MAHNFETTPPISGVAVNRTALETVQLMSGYARYIGEIDHQEEVVSHYVRRGPVDDFNDRQRSSFRSRTGYVLASYGVVRADMAVDGLSISMGAHYVMRIEANNGDFQHLFGEGRSFLGFLRAVALGLRSKEGVAVSKQQFPDMAAVTAGPAEWAVGLSASIEITDTKAAVDDESAAPYVGMAVGVRSFSAGSKATMASMVARNLPAVTRERSGFSEMQGRINPEDANWHGVVYVPQSPSEVLIGGRRTKGTIDNMIVAKWALEAQGHSSSAIGRRALIRTVMNYGAPGVIGDRA